MARKKAETLKTPDSVRFLLCDDLHVELLGKLTVLGLFPADSISVHPRKGTQAEDTRRIDSLCVVWILNGGGGSAPARASVTAPDGSELLAQESPSVELGSSSSTIIATKAQNLAVRAFGTYRAQLAIGNLSFKHEFKILRGEPIDLGNKLADRPRRQAKTTTRAKKKRA